MPIAQLTTVNFLTLNPPPNIVYRVFIMYFVYNVATIGRKCEFNGGRIKIKLKITRR